MPVYLIGIDISKYKHNCCIISAADQKVFSKFTLKNDKAEFELTAHYAPNLELFLENTHHYYMEVIQSLLRNTKNQQLLGVPKLMTVEYNPYSKEFCHTYSL